MDAAIYDENGEQRNAPEAMSAAEARMSAIQGGSWIIDGYRVECVKEAWLAEADRIVFLSLGRWTCFRRTFKQYLVDWVNKRRRRRRAKRPDTACPAGQKAPGGGGKKRPLYMVCYRIIWHLNYILLVEHSPKFEAFYMGVGGRYPEKFVVLRSQKEIDRFQKAALECADR